ncbi:MAG: hypothetical protein GX811_11880 [Lentisphaerae bacterium]|nr:hypothetical protein [Lentisphaerota bacterium]
MTVKTSFLFRSILVSIFILYTSAIFAEVEPVTAKLAEFVQVLKNPDAKKQEQVQAFAQLTSRATWTSCQASTNTAALEASLLEVKSLAESKKVTVALDDVLNGLAEFYKKVGEREKEEAVYREIAALPEAKGQNMKRALAFLSNRVSGAKWNVWSAQHTARYIDLKPEPFLAEMKKEYEQLLKKRKELESDNIVFLLEYANYQISTAGKVDDGLAVYENLLTNEKLTNQQCGEVYYGLVNAALMKGDESKARALLKEFKEKNLSTAGRRGHANYVSFLLSASKIIDGDSVLDNLELPLYSGAKIYPHPQKVVYTEKFVNLKSVKLELGQGITLDSPGFRYILPKLKRMGVVIDPKGEFTLRVNSVSMPMAPEKPEGYALTVNENGASISGYDKQGTVWGLVSFLQLIDNEDGPKVRVCEVRDWPVMPVRGFYNTAVSPLIPEMAIYAKMNLVIMQSGSALSGGLGLTPLVDKKMSAMTTLLRDFGFQVMYGAFNYTMYPKYPLSSERTFELHKEVFGKVGAMGAGIYFPYDDGRYPLHPQDVEINEIGANQDAKYLTKLYQTIKAEHPTFSMIFCPPFYWGPDAPASYPEDRVNYLKSLGEHLDPEILVFWTGPRVKGYEVTADKVEWFANLIGRKPVYGQNGWGPHNLIHYTADPIHGWVDWHYPGFQQDVYAYLSNSNIGMQAPVLATIGDWQWNERDFDAERSTRATVAVYYGKDMYDIMRPAVEALSKIDKYRYGSITHEAVGEIPMLEEIEKIAQDSLAKAKAYNEEALNRLPCYFEQAVGFATKALNSARTAPDFYQRYKSQIEEVRLQAVADLGYDPERGDILKHAVNLQGGQAPMVYGFQSPARFGMPFRGKDFIANKVSCSFECDPFPPSGSYTLYLSGQYETIKGEPEFQIRIVLNGEEVYLGPCNLVVSDWKVASFELPFEKLKRGNSLVIESATPGSTQSGPPWLFVNYIMLRP